MPQNLQNYVVYKFGMTGNLTRRIWDYRNGLNFCNLGRKKKFIYITTFELNNEQTAKKMEECILKKLEKNCMEAKEIVYGLSKDDLLLKIEQVLNRKNCEYKKRVYPEYNCKASG